MKDPIKAAILGSQLGMLAHFAIYDSMGIPPAGLNPPKITLRGDLTPQQEGNLAQTQGYNDGPFGASIGPQGREGQAANDNAINQGFINGNPFDGGMPSSITPGQAIQPGGAPGQAGPGMAGPGLAPVAPGVSGQSSVLTPQVNNPHTQPISMPGSGATTRTPVGHVKQTNQRRGK